MTDVVVYILLFKLWVIIQDAVNQASTEYPFLLFQQSNISKTQVKAGTRFSGHADDLWTAPVYAGEYVRGSFRDITRLLYLYIFWQFLCFFLSVLNPSPIQALDQLIQLASHSGPTQHILDICKVSTSPTYVSHSYPWYPCSLCTPAETFLRIFKET